jgi:hypothetical protein
VSTYPLGVTKNLGTWNFQNNHVERLLDNSTYDAANPDDTLILAGPARKGVVQVDRRSSRSLMALGMFQSISFQSAAQIQPAMAIGSGRSFFLRGKSQTNWNISRVMMNGRNLLRALYHGAVEAGIINLDSELFYIPFGLAVIIRTKSHTLVAGIYIELCLIGSYSNQITAGQPMLMENINGVADRILPFQAPDAMNAPAIGRALMDSVLGLAGNIYPEPKADRLGTFADTGLDSSVVQGL